MNQRNLLVLLALLFLASCYYDNREEMYPVIVSDCDTLEVSFTGTITPILTTYCYGCHSNATAPYAGNNIALEDYADVKAAGENGSLFGAMDHQSGYSPMPKGTGKLDDCTLLKIQTWIENDYPEN